MRINPGIYVLDLGPDRRQFGLGTGALLLAGLTPADLAFVGLLRGGVPDGTEQAAAAASGVGAERQSQLVTALAPVLLPCTDNQHPLPPLRQERLGPDVQRLSAVYGQDASAAVARRAGAAVEIQGLGRCGALLARTLAAAGIGTLLLGDPRIVAPSDVGPAYALTDIGMQRFQAVRRHLYRIDPTVRVLAVPGPDPGRPPAGTDLAVLVSDQPGPLLTIAGGDREQPHLAVAVQQYGYQIGPLVVPGSTACLGCLDRYRGDTDPGWYAASAALEPQQPESGSPPGPGGEEVSAASLAAGIAAGQALSFIDGVAQPVTWSAVLQLRAADGHIGVEPLEFHPGCGCQLQAAGASRAA
ncbi:ThiF family adenylyltransferase [Arthrobacter sp. Sa2BUA2]|uniref:ThiF family adenylyltransferase n=1 Tax=Arthrobacter pullicola TaxID=2762224 RepID=A0ABR8YIY1_9MICC|nr:ThiF family adenylyltransferase [Arthrobacter pullicola]MBD8044164.1 ThiF family adenylyltransferase [Arthrobacter pullicola]